MKTIAFYLPQFHEIPENNEWWGKGFTEWVNIKKAKPLFDGHYQPRVPLDHNYYDLSDIKVMKWQTKMAKKYGVYGFCFYHYWFDGHLLLEKPVENFLGDKTIDFPFCICWANEHWTNAWVSKENKVLIEQKYGEEKEWRQHFEYLLPFLKDERYIKEDGKPLFVIYRPEIIECLNDMLDYWQKLAVENGLPGIVFAYQHPSYYVYPGKDESRFQYYIEYQPTFARAVAMKQNHRILRTIKRKISVFTENKLGLDIRHFTDKKLTRFDYDETWNAILNIKPEEKALPGAFVDWDNTPRRQNTGSVYDGVSPEKFLKYMTKQIKNAKENYKKDYLFLFAWNEWAEGGYMEPDEKRKFGMLEALREALIRNNEFPWDK